MYDFVYYEVRDVMTLKPVTVNRDVTLSYKDRLVGIVAREDIIRALRQAAQGQGPDRNV